MVLQLLEGHAIHRYMSVLHNLQAVEQRESNFDAVSVPLNEIASWTRGCLPVMRRTDSPMDSLILTLDAWGISGIDRKVPQTFSSTYAYAVDDGEATFQASMLFKVRTYISYLPSRTRQP